MREIKFNAWLPELGFMLEDVAVGHGSISFPFIDEPEDEFYQFLKSKGLISDEEDNLPEYLYENGEDWCSIVDEKHFVLLQYTGLKDKNGVEIYEGYLIKVTSLDKEYPLIDEIHEVRWPSYSVVLYPGDLQEDCDDMQYLTQGDYEFEQIGNIYENPELL